MSRNLIDEIKDILPTTTPGPWKWQEHTQDGIAGVLEPYMCQGEGFIETNDANARLIALAPDLARLAVAAAELAEASQGLIDLSENTSPFGGEIMQDRIERANENFRQALARFRAITEAKE